jgi:hypothetical protein
MLRRNRTSSSAGRVIAEQQQARAQEQPNTLSVKQSVSLLRGVPLLAAAEDSELVQVAGE